jgi:hypothetical protein
MKEPYDWSTGYCFACRKFVRDGQGMQEVEGGEVLRFCWKDFKERCLNLAPAKTERAKLASRA